MYALLIVGTLMLTIQMPANAQTAAKAAKAVAGLVKGSSKKVATKTIKFKPKATSSSTSKSRPRLYNRYTDCSACNGKGKVSVWNSYYNCYTTQTCVRCSGTGRTKRY